MAKKDLQVIINQIQNDIMKSSAAYREAVSNKDMHDVSIDVEQIKNECLIELASRGGWRVDKVPLNLQRIVDKYVPVMCQTIYNECVIWDNEKSGQFFQITRLKGSSNSFEFLISSPPEKGGQVFKRLQKMKQDSQKPLLTAIKTAIKKMNKGRTNKIAEVKDVFLDIGHREGSAVSEQRKKVAEAALFEFGSGLKKNSKIAKQFFADIAALTTLIITKTPGDPTDVHRIEFENSTINKSKGASKEQRIAEQLDKDLQFIIEKYADAEFIHKKGSDSRFERIRKSVLTPIGRTAQRHAKITANFKGEKPQIGSRTTARTKAIKPKVTRVVKKDKTPAPTPVFDTQSTQSMFSVMAMIEQKLPQVVKKNMGYPRLENASGRFAESVSMVNVIQTKKGFPSFGYTYIRDPYEVFEVGSKGNWATPERDPRKLIDASIREIAANMALGRFFTRRV